MLREASIIKFLGQVKQEALKVIWPTKQELFLSVAVVFLAVSLVSVACLVLDYCVHSGISFLLNIGK